MGEQDDVVGVETLDDVSIISPNKTLLEQDKLTLSTSGSPMTNRSESPLEDVRYMDNGLEPARL
jgi:hypothetical protein